LACKTAQGIAANYYLLLLGRFSKITSFPVFFNYYPMVIFVKAMKTQQKQFAISCIQKQTGISRIKNTSEVGDLLGGLRLAIC
jgi:hypothetical protein